MLQKLNGLFKNLHLIISLLITVPAAIIYGSPLLPLYLNIHADTADFANMLKATMCLYLGIAAVWLLGIIKSKYWKAATQFNILFMLSLATGRALSMLTDGLPTGGYIFGITAELVIGFFALYQLKKYSPQ